MPGITLAQAEAKLTEAMTAYSNALEAQSFSRGPVSKANADLEKLQKSVEFWDAKVKQLSSLSAGKIRVRSGYYDG